MRRLQLLTTIFALLFLFSACGQSGPLYVPGNPTTMAVPPSQNTNSDEDEQDDSDEGSEGN